MERTIEEVDIDQTPQLEDKLKALTHGRLFTDEYGIPTCSTCKRTNIKRSKAGNLYCGDLCWLEKNDDKIHGYDDGEPPYEK